MSSDAAFAAWSDGIGRNIDAVVSPFFPPVPLDGHLNTCSDAGGAEAEVADLVRQLASRAPLRHLGAEGSLLQDAILPHEAATCPTTQSTPGR
jgi:hypothetical protein